MPNCAWEGVPNWVLGGGSNCVWDGGPNCVWGEGPWEELLCPMGCEWVHSVSWPEDKVSPGVITSVGFGWINCTVVP